MRLLTAILGIVVDGNLRVELSCRNGSERFLAPLFARDLLGCLEDELAGMPGVLKIALDRAVDHCLVRSKRRPTQSISPCGIRSLNRASSNLNLPRYSC